MFGAKENRQTGMAGCRMYIPGDCDITGAFMCLSVRPEAA